MISERWKNLLQPTSLNNFKGAESLLVSSSILVCLCVKKINFYCVRVTVHFVYIRVASPVVTLPRLSYIQCLHREIVHLKPFLWFLKILLVVANSISLPTKISYQCFYLELSWIWSTLKYFKLDILLLSLIMLYFNLFLSFLKSIIYFCTNHTYKCVNQFYEYYLLQPIYFISFKENI